ncbi:MAG: GrpB family protein [Armatimonadota bacterium]
MVLVEYDPKWATLYADEAECLRSVCPEILGTEHIGSTAIPGMDTVPTIDILVRMTSVDAIIPQLVEHGYGQVHRCEYPLLAKQGYDLHLTSGEHPIAKATLFRDHLREYPVIAERYRKLKHLHAGNPESYAVEKLKFIQSITERAELGRRYPIVVVEHDPRWVKLYEEEALFLASEFGLNTIIRTEHFGSTAVPGLDAKPIVDILVEVPSFKVIESRIIPRLEELGYFHSYQPDGHVAFWKGYIPDMAEKYHLHMAPGEHPLMDRLFFRDYLRKYPETARLYVELKHRLAGMYPHDREEYTDAKAKFVREITERAKVEFSAK